MSSTVTAARARFDELAAQLGDDLSHPRAPELLAAARDGACRSELQTLLQRAAARLEQLPAQHLLLVCETAAALALHEEALSLSERAACAAEPAVAALRGELAMRLGRHAQALQAADCALAALLQPGLALDEFLALVARGAPPEGLLRYARGAVAQRASLREPIALRWEAARRLGMQREANLMRLLCLRYFPERASVWATAGNQALDEGDLTAADGYFRRCLDLDPHWTAGLAGLAIVLEQQKDWEAALDYRRRVVEVERALEHAAPASLQRVLRYAAALARLSRWSEAEPLFRRCVALGAYASLPAERPVLERVFSRELYAPALLAGFEGARAERAPELALGLHEASKLASLYRALEQAPGHDAPLLLGICAWLAGDMARAYALLDEAELTREGDTCVQYFLLDAARALDHPERPAVERYAAHSARGLLAQPEAADEEAVFYARLTLERLGEAAPRAPLPEGPLGLAQLYALEPSHDTPLPSLACALAPGLRRIAAFRGLLRARGTSPLTAAARSCQALSELPG